MLRAVEDTLSIVVLRYIDPLTYIVLSQFRLCLTAWLSAACLPSKPTVIAGMSSFVTVALATSLLPNGVETLSLKSIVLPEGIRSGANVCSAASAPASRICLRKLQLQTQTYSFQQILP